MSEFLLSSTLYPRSSFFFFFVESSHSRKIKSKTVHIAFSNILVLRPNRSSFFRPFLWLKFWSLRTFICAKIRACRLPNYPILLSEEFFLSIDFPILYKLAPIDILVKILWNRNKFNWDLIEVVRKFLFSCLPLFKNQCTILLFISSEHDVLDTFQQLQFECPNILVTVHNWIFRQWT